MARGGGGSAGTRAGALLVAGLVVLGLGAVGWALWGPGALSPVSWQPTLPQVAWTPTGGLDQGWQRAVPGHGPEDVDRWGGGLVTGLHDGRVVWLGDGGQTRTLVDTGGRVLGLAPTGDGALLLADAHRGLLRWTEAEGLTVLADACGGSPLGLTDDVDLGPDGTVWFTDASTRHALPDWKRDLVEAVPTGRLCRWWPGAGSDAEEVRGGLGFANGVAVDATGDTVFVVETSRQRVRRLRLAPRDEGGGLGGARDRTSAVIDDDVILDGLPGYPDGISRGASGRYWLAVASPRVGLLDALSTWPLLRRVADRLPVWMQPAPERTARVMGISAEGAVEVDLFDPDGRLTHVVTSVQERDGELLLGSLAATAVAGRPVP